MTLNTRSVSSEKSFRKMLIFVGASIVDSEERVVNQVPLMPEHGTSAVKLSKIPTVLDFYMSLLPDLALINIIFKNVFYGFAVFFILKNEVFVLRLSYQGNDY